MKLKQIVEGFSHNDDIKQLSTEEKKRVLSMVSEYNSLGKALNREGSLPDVAKQLAEIADGAQQITLSETESDWFDGQTVKKNMNELNKSSKEFNKIASEAHTLEQRMTALYEDMGHILGRYFDIKEPIEEVTDIGDI